MKYVVLLMCIGFSVISFAQNAQKDLLNKEVNGYVKNATEAADKFLNKQLSPAERIKAIEPFDIIYDDQQIKQFKKVITDDKERPPIRAVALDKISEYVQDDKKLWALTLQWLSDPQTPKVLRHAALDLVASFSFSSMEIPDAYQKMLEDPDEEFRRFAFTQLILHGDARAQQKLIEGLENPRSALLPTPVAIGVLSMSLKKEYYPALYKVLHQTKDEATRLEAIRALGFYKAARADLIAISRNKNEKEQFREAALGALFSGDRDNIVSYVLPLLYDRNTPQRMQIIGIQMTIDVRQSMTYRAKANKADKYDELMKRIANDKSSSPDLQKIALKYMQHVRPTY